MTDLMLKKEIRRIVRESGYDKNKKLLTPVLKILQMEHNVQNTDILRASTLARQILS